VQNSISSVNSISNPNLRRTLMAASIDSQEILVQIINDSASRYYISDDQQVCKCLILVQLQPYQKQFPPDVNDFDMNTFDCEVLIYF
jgi:hypothetical protein